MPFFLMSININIGKDMQILDTKTEQELLASLLAEIAKASAEIKCAQGDLNKAQSRISFVLAVVNTLIDRKGD